MKPQNLFKNIKNGAAWKRGFEAEIQDLNVGENGSATKCWHIIFRKVSKYH